MRLKLKHITLSLSLLTLAVACKEQEDISLTTPSDGKTPIEVNASTRSSLASGAMTRASIIDGEGKIAAFEKPTRLTLLMISDNAKTSPTNSKYTVTYALAKGKERGEDGKLIDGSKSDVSFESTKTVSEQLYTDPTGESNETKKTIDNGDGSWRFWDDAHARSSYLSIYGFAVNNTVLPCGAPWSQKINGKTCTDANGWENFVESDFNYNIGGTNIAWTIGDQTRSNDYKCQTFLSLLYKDDVCYSNNIAGDARMKFNNSDPDAAEYLTFDHGNLVFNHAMSMLSFKIVPGDGFDTNSNKNFNFKSGTNIALKGFYKKGYLNIKTGKWIDCELGQDATYNNETGYSWNRIGSTTGDKTIDQIDDHMYYLLALVIPGTDLSSESVKDAVTFIIDDNEYKLSMKQLYDAIKATIDADSNKSPQDYFDETSTGNYTKLKPGINYEFTFTVGKTKIDNITAQLVDWKTVTAEATPDNAHPLTITMETYAGTKTPAASYLYKSAVSSATTDGNGKGYSNSTRFNLQAKNEEQNTGWYWESNSTYYHFRTITQKDKSGNNIDLKEKEDETKANYITMTGGAVESTIDYVWGAPLQEKHSSTPHNIPYDQSNGYKDYLYPAIGPTKSNIHITQFHMMSDLEINLKTTTENDKVDLTDATITLNGYANTANLMVGTGLVTDWDNYITSPTALTKATTTTSGYAQTFNWRVVPQVITPEDPRQVSLVIETKDGNIYEIKDLSALPVTITGSSDTTIPTWEPGKKYIYNLTLKKTGIDHITATVVNWVNVEATNENIQIQ